MINFHSLKNTKLSVGVKHKLWFQAEIDHGVETFFVLCHNFFKKKFKIDFQRKKTVFIKPTVKAKLVQ